MKRILFWILIPALLIPLLWVIVFKFEGTKPLIDVELPSSYLKKDYEFSLHVADKKNGLRKIVVSIMQQGKEEILLEKQYKGSVFTGLLSKSKNAQESFIIPVESASYGMSDGEAVIRVMASDLSWRGWNKGNIAYTEEKVFIDSSPPRVQVLTRRHNIERGGSALVIYKLFENNITSGVKVGDNFFPGHSGLFENENIYAAFFALNHMQGAGTPISIMAEDLAGNVTQREFYHYIRDKKFRKDTLNISKGFLEKKIPDFDVGTQESRFASSKNPLLEKFLYINNTIRKKNAEVILSVPSGTENKKLWNGRFLRMRNAAKRAGFADRRTYKNEGKEIDKAVHLGIDLASTSNVPIRAANSGRVVFSQFIGIYGNTVIIDHGFGLCSLYAHLNQSSVAIGDLVEKGQEIGFSGLTGLAGGDHLHFSMIVHNVFVNPVEWWDDAWIKNNITSKIDAVSQLSD